MAGSLVTNSAAFKFDVYGPSVHCYANAVSNSAGVPLQSHLYRRDDVISLSIPAGPHTLVLTTFSDSAGKKATGSSCLEQNLSADSELCYNVSVSAIEVGCEAAKAISCGSHCCDPLFGACNNDCTLQCDPGYADCNSDPADGCEVNLKSASKKLCRSACIDINACCVDSDCTSPPSPAACFAGSCGLNGTCSYATRNTATRCGGTCCNSINGSCSPSDCTVSCLPSFGNCDGDVGNGCEAALKTDSQNCGQCGRACLVDSKVSIPSCNGGLCTSTCQTGYANCNRPAEPASDDGCECQTPGCCGTQCQSAHHNGFGQIFFDCAIVGSHDQMQATSAARAYNIMGTVVPMSYSDANGTVSAVCNETSVDCPCWAYAATGTYLQVAGHALRAVPASSTNCVVPTMASGPTWD
jgi:hypothetical protein